MHLKDEKEKLASKIVEMSDAVTQAEADRKEVERLKAEVRELKTELKATKADNEKTSADYLKYREQQE